MRAVLVYRISFVLAFPCRTELAMRLCRLACLPLQTGKKY